MPIYTKTGDRGKTSLFSGKRVWKNHIRVGSYGTIDELNAVLGVVDAYLAASKIRNKTYIKEILGDVQSTLFYLGSYLADLPDVIDDVDLPKKTREFEHWIDEMTEKMPRLTNFILPGGSVVGALFQQARTICRRGERNLVQLAQKEEVEESVTQYINRLSDLLFTLSRYTNFLEKKKETIWQR